VTILEFPGAEDREVIRTAAQTWLQTRHLPVRETMSGVLEKMLTKYSANRIVVGNMVVVNRNGRVKVSSKKVAVTNHCPCGQYIYSDSVKILYINEQFRTHEVIYGCQACGDIFTKKEDVGEC
jgi:hypothetical protein